MTFNQSSIRVGILSIELFFFFFHTLMHQADGKKYQACQGVTIFNSQIYLAHSLSITTSAFQLCDQTSTYSLFLIFICQIKADALLSTIKQQYRLKSGHHKSSNIYFSVRETACWLWKSKRPSMLQEKATTVFGSRVLHCLRKNFKAQNQPIY